MLINLCMMIMHVQLISNKNQLNMNYSRKLGTQRHLKFKSNYANQENQGTQRLAEIIQNRFSELMFKMPSPKNIKNTHQNLEFSDLISSKKNTNLKNQEDRIKSIEPKKMFDKHLKGQDNFSNFTSCQNYSSKSIFRNKENFNSINKLEKQCLNHQNKTAQFMAFSQDKQFFFCQKCAILLISQKFNVERIETGKTTRERNKSIKKAQSRKYIEEIFFLKGLISQKYSEFQSAHRQLQKRLKLSSMNISQFFDHCIDIIEKQKSEMLNELQSHFQSFMLEYQEQMKMLKFMNQQLITFQKEFEENLKTSIKRFSSRNKSITQHLQQLGRIQTLETNCLEDVDFTPYLLEFGNMLKILFFGTDQCNNDIQIQCEILKLKNQVDKCSRSFSFDMKQKRNVQKTNSKQPLVLESKTQEKEIENIPVAQSIEEWSKESVRQSLQNPLDWLTQNQS